MDTPQDIPPSSDFNPTRAKAAQDLAVPAILMMVMAGFTLLYSLVSLAAPIDPEKYTHLYSDPSLPPQWRDAVMWMLSPGGRIVSTVPGLVINGLVAFGGWKMKNLQSYGLSMTAAILCCIPCCGPCMCLSLVPGIWSVILLNRPDVKAAFR